MTNVTPHSFPTMSRAPTPTARPLAAQSMSASRPSFLAVDNVMIEVWAPVSTMVCREGVVREGVVMVVVIFRRGGMEEVETLLVVVVVVVVGV